MKKNVSKKQIALILVAICLVGLIGIGVSYSYFLANISTSKEENKNSNISTTTITQVVMDMQGKISSDGAYPGHKMVKEVVVRGIGADDATPANASIQITPDLGDFANDVTWRVYKSDTPITCTSTKHVDGGQFYEEASCNIPDSAVLMLEGGATSSFKNIVVNPNTEAKYYLVIEYLNKEDEDQSDEMNKSFSIDIGVGNRITSLADNITALSKDDKINLATDDPDNNIRYIGANPNNYVYFNCSDYSNQSDSTCEKWRIIGVFNNVTKSDGTKENLVKIIRNERIGNYSWDNKNMSTGAETDSGKNDWATARLNYLLNPGHDSESVGGSLYYNAESGTCYYGQNNATISCDFNSTGLKNNTTRNAIESVVWSLGGISDYNTATPQKFYNDERNSQVFSGRLSTWTGKIALMYPSDYGYATSGGSTTDRQACLKKELYNWYDDSMSDCINNNYIYNSGIFQYTLNHYNNYSYDIYVIDKNGSVHRSSVWLERPVKPTLYLKSNISLKSGDGTSETPYQLNL